MSTVTSANVQALLKEAHGQIKSLRARLAEQEKGRRDPIAVIGIGCRFPGGVNSAESFWRVLADGVDAVSELPEDRWDVSAFYDADVAAAGKHYSRHGAFLEKVDEFDYEFFGLVPAEVAHLDPQQRLLLEVAWEAIENAGLAADRLRGSNTGTYVGAIYADYLIRQLAEAGPENINAYYGTGNTPSALAGRISYTFGWHGPSISVDTACSTSLVAVHLACNAIRGGECDMAIAGGVNLMLTPEPLINLSKARMMSPTGRCRTFDAAADGYVRGEGCGLVLLKRLSKAEADGDRILGVIRGSAVNHDGRSNGLTAPNRQAQTALIRSALAAADVRPGEVGYAECHGTGTSLGDPIEVAAIMDALVEGRDAAKSLAFGAVKTNYGHLEGAAGVCGLIKTMLVLEHGEVPANLHFTTLNPHIKTGDKPVFFPAARTPWFQGYDSRIAGVSSFGLLGTNAHVVLEGYRAVSESADSVSQSRLLALSARTPVALRELAQSYLTWLRNDPEIRLADMCHTANLGRNHFEQRAAVVADTTAPVREGLEAILAASPGTPRTPNSRPRVAFLFTGQGSQYAGMGRELYESEPVFRDALDRCGRSNLNVIYPGPGENAALIDETEYTQTALFAFEYALAELWASWGIQPSVALGHSVGEYAAACRAGIFSLEDGLRLVAARGALMQALPRDGAMAAVRAPEEVVREELAAFARTLSVAAFNSDNEIVISGRREDLEIVTKRLGERGYAAQALRVSHAFHSPLMQPMLEEFERVLRTVQFGRARFPIISNVTGRLAEDDAMSRPEYWREHVMAPVRFAESARALAEYRCDVVMEIGPQPVLTKLLRKNVPDAAWTPIECLKRGGNDSSRILAATGRLYEAGCAISWTEFERHRAGRRVSLPTYPFQRRRCWFETPPGRDRRAIRYQPPRRSSGLKFSVMFFAATEKPLDGDKYRLVLEAAKFADRHGFESVWVPERHFSNMGCLYPNAAVLHAALARETQRIRLMGGSVVAPLHHPIRIAEEWAMVDNLSGGRVGISFASGWNPDDFAFFPDRYAQRRDHLYSVADAVRRLWRGETIEAINGIGRAFQAKLLPTPLQKELPFWITAAGNPASFEKAGEKGANLLTHLLDQDVEELAGKIRLYRESRARHGHDPAAGIVTVMVHTSVAPDAMAAREAVRAPFCSYLRASKGLLAGLAQSRGHDVNIAALSERDLDDLVAFLFERFWSTRALIGSPESCEPLVRALAEAGVNEIASLLDFGQPVDDVLAGLPKLQELRDRCEHLVSVHPKAAPLAPTRVAVDPDWLYDVAWRPLPEPASAASAGGRWLVLARADGVGTALAETCCVANELPDGLGEFAGIVFLRALDEPDSVTELARRLVQALPAAIPVWWVTRGAMRLDGDTHLPALAQSPLWGFARVIRHEHPEWKGGLIDLDPAASDEANASSLMNFLRTPDGEDAVAIRGGTRFGQRLVRASGSHRNLAAACTSDAGYLVTGGLGGVGLTVAEWLVERGARNLLLLSRSQVGPRARQTIAALEARGVVVDTAAVDVADESVLARALQEWRDSGKPPIRGVFHAAGTWHDAPMSRMDAATLAEVLAPKVAGTWNLERQLGAEPLDFFVSFSSLSSLLPANGQANYAAANAYLDAHAQWRRAQGRPALSVNWGPWSEVGFGATETGLRAHRRLESFGMYRLSPAEAMAALGELMSSGAEQAAVAKVDWEVLSRVDPELAAIPLLSELTSTIEIHPAAPAQTLDLADLSDSERIDLIRSAVVGIVAAVFRQPAIELRVEEPLQNLGLDSLMAVEIKNRILARMDVNIPIALFLGGASVNALVDWMNTELQLRELSTPESAGELESPTEEFAL